MNSSIRESVLLRGMFSFQGNKSTSFKGPIKKGFRPIVWLTSVHQSTSCSFILDTEIFLGEEKEAEIVLLNQLQLGKKIRAGLVLNVGSALHKIGEFKVTQHLGPWNKGNVP